MENDNWVLKCRVRCVCGHVTTVLHDGSIATCVCGKDVWIEDEGYGKISPNVSGDPWIPLKFNKPVIVKMEWIEKLYE